LTTVAISGLGAISAAGKGLEATRETFRRGPVQPAPVSVFPSTLTYPVFEVSDLEQEDPSPGLRSLDLARAAVREALEDAGLDPFPAGRRVGICLGTTVASQVNDLAFYRSYREGGPVKLDSVERYLRGNLAGAIQRELGVRGPAVTVVNACSSGADAIGVALSWIQSGSCEIAIAGGADEMCSVPLSGFGVLGILSDSACRPFDRARDGLNLGEGAGVLVLETRASLKARGRAAALSLVGYGSAIDAHHLTAPHPQGLGLERAVRFALAAAKVAPGEIGFVNAHGTGTTDNDLVEATTLARVLGPEVRFLSTKGFTGHTLGAAGGLEAAFTALALRHGELPASAGFAEVDPEIGLRPLSAPISVDRDHAVSTSLAFGGGNAALVLRREPSHR
jgi:3-oxoacyl-[acyl-carrier-protein] synthase II